MRTIKDLLRQEKKVYFVLPTKAMRYRFMSDADREGITFGDGVKAADRMSGDIMALLPNGHICFVGWVGRLCFKQGGDSVLRVDYERYINEEDSYLTDASGNRL